MTAVARTADRPNIIWSSRLGQLGVADIIAHHQVTATGREKCIAGIIDGLIRVGHQIVSGNWGKR